MEPKKVTPEVANAFNQLLKLARQVIDENPPGSPEYMWSAVTLMSEKNNTYSFWVNMLEPEPVWEKLKAEDDTHILYAVVASCAQCDIAPVWPEPPSAALRLGLLDLDPKNEEMLFALRGETAIVLKTLSVMMPKK